MRLNNLHIENFKGISRYDFTPHGMNASIYGDNATGKTTVYDAFLWLLFGKDSTDRKDFEIKPLQPDGAVIHNLDTTVKAEICHQGKEIVLQRTYAEKWERKRGSLSTEMTGHTTSFFINELPVKLAEYKDYIDKICQEATFKAITSADYFCLMPWQKRREMLFTIAGGVTEDEVFSSDPNLAPLLEAKGEHTVDEWKRVCANRRITANKALASIPDRIDEAKRGIVETTHTAEQMQDIIAALMAERQALTDSIAQQSNVALANLRAELKGVDADIAALESNNAMYRARKAAAAKDTVDAANKPVRDRINTLWREHAEWSTSADYAKDAVRKATKHLDDLRAEFAKVDAEQWDGQMVCPTCKREYPKDDVAKAKALFEAHKAERLNEINSTGSSEKVLRDAAQERLEESEKRVNEIYAEIERLSGQMMTAEDTPIENCDGYEAAMAAYTKERARISEAVMTMAMSESDAQAQIRRKIADVDLRLSEAHREADAIQGNNSIADRVNELTETLRRSGDDLDDAERQIILCEQYTKALVGLTETKVDGKFTLVRWKLFDEQINGGLSECCTATVNGVPYSDLNHAMQINAGLDIVDTLGKFYGMSAPVFVDNAESVTEMHRIDAQTVRLVVSAEDKTLRTEIDG